MQILKLNILKISVLTECAGEEYYKDLKSNVGKNVTAEIGRVDQNKIRKQVPIISKVYDDFDSIRFNRIAKRADHN